MDYESKEYQEVLDIALDLYFGNVSSKTELEIYLNNLEQETRKKVETDFKIIGIEQLFSKEISKHELPHLYELVMSNIDDVPRYVLVLLLKKMKKPIGATKKSEREKIRALKGLNTFIAFAVSPLVSEQNLRSEKAAILEWLGRLKPSPDNEYENSIKEGYLTAEKKHKNNAENNIPSIESDIFQPIYHRVYKDLRKIYPQ